MFDAIVVGLVVTGLAAGAIGVLSAWYESRSFRARGLPPLIVIPRPVTPVEPMVGAVARPSPPKAPLEGGNVVKEPGPQSPPTVGERIVSDDSLLADADAAPSRATDAATVRFPRPVSPRLSALEPSYEIIRALGGGETSVVYLARERASGDEVAIKLIRSKYLGDEEAMGRFAREARVLERLVHPSIVRVRAVLELGEAGLAIVMAYVPGRTLKELLRKDGRLTPERAERFTRDIACALGAAHAMGIVHRDVKPENVFVDSDDRLLLADFGLARSMIGDAQLTMDGVAIGTPAYMAPEQIDGGSLDARGDVYSLGLVAWEMLSGRRPWEGESVHAVLYHQRYDQLPDVRDLRDDVPDSFADAIAVAIEKDPRMRWQNTGQMIEGLDVSPTPQRITLRPPLSADTVRFTRPSPRATHFDGPVGPARANASSIELGPRSTPPGWGAHEPSFIGSAAFESVAGELEALDTELVSKTRRRYLLAMVGVAAVMMLVAVVAFAANVQIHSSDVGPASSAENPRARLSGTRESPDKTTARKDATKTDAKTDSKTAGNNQSKKAITTADKTANTPAPLAVVGDVRFTAIATGLAHSCAIARNGAAWCWGENERGQLGDRSKVPHRAPRPIAESRKFTAVGVGVAHSCALDIQSKALCWGSNAHGQLGSESSASDIAAPTLVAGDHHYSSIALGWNFTCALDGGRAFCWGENANGQLGDRSITDRRVPVPVVGGLTFRSIAAGATHACGVTPRGEAYCWGNNDGGQLGDGTRVSRAAPTAVKTALRFAAIATGALHTCAVTADGQAFCWGRDNYGQLGDGGYRQDSTEPVRVVGNHSFAVIRAFGSHTCATTPSGEGFCWGYNLDGQLGDGSRVNRARPVYVEMPPGK